LLRMWSHDEMLASKQKSTTYTESSKGDVRVT
jgi:hypothetical protein